MSDVTMIQSATRYGLIVCAFTVFLSTAISAQTIESIERASVAPINNAQGQSYSYDPRMSGDGRFIAFTSTADNFAAAGNEDGKFHEHLYLRDTLTGVTTQVDVTASGRTGSPGQEFNTGIRVFRSSLHPRLSRDGKYLAFTSTASDISPDGNGESFGNWAYLKNLETGDIRRIPFATAGDLNKLEYPTYMAISGDGSKLVIMSIISDQTTKESPWELTVYDRASNTTTLINTGIIGNKFNAELSDDGRFVVFDNQVDGQGAPFTGPTYAYVYDLTLGQATQLNDGKLALSPSISGDGAYIAYSDSSVVPTRIKLRERETGIETLVSAGLDGSEPAGMSAFPSLSQNGRYIAFLSTAENLVAEDSNGSDDIFVFDRDTRKTTLISVQGTCKGVVSNEDFNTGPPSISSDGKTVTFAVLERLIAADKKNSLGIVEKADTNSFDDVYVAKINYDSAPSVFKKGLTPVTPFASVGCRGDEARLQVQSIITGLNNSVSPSKGNKREQIRTVTQEVLISRTGPSGRQELRKKLVARRNVITTRGLPAGNYVAQVQARALLNNGTVTRSRISKGAKFTITK
jgi:Tol biopolymer transport system component